MIFKKSLYIMFALCSLSLYAEEMNTEDPDSSTKCEKNYIPSITGFYAGADAGGSYLRSTFTLKDYEVSGNKNSKKNDKDSDKTASEVGFMGDIFCGYNFQSGRLLLGAEGLAALETAKPTADIPEATDTKKEDILKISQKRKYSFGVKTKIGARLTKDLTGYASLGALLGKYSLEGTDAKNTKKDEDNEKKETKPSLLVGLGLEYNFGSFFLRGECDKTFKRNLIKQDSDKIDTDSYIFKIGAGYHF